VLCRVKMMVPSLPLVDAYREEEPEAGKIDYRCRILRFIRTKLTLQMQPSVWAKLWMCIFTVGFGPQLLPMP
jgi:hypothetical protein